VQSTTCLCAARLRLRDNKPPLRVILKQVQDDELV